MVHYTVSTVIHTLFNHSFLVRYLSHFPFSIVKDLAYRSHTNVISDYFIALHHITLYHIIYFPPHHICLRLVTNKSSPPRQQVSIPSPEQNYLSSKVLYVYYNSYRLQLIMCMYIFCDPRAKMIEPFHINFGMNYVYDRI